MSAHIRTHVGDIDLIGLGYAASSALSIMGKGTKGFKKD